jgi:hypothetical protein
MTIIDAIHDPNLFRPLFKHLDSWRAWLVVLKAIFALPMSDEDLRIFRQLTDRITALTGQVYECALVIGRRGGKSFIVALIGAFLACFCDYSRYLSPGERGVVMIIATDRKQARVIMRYMTAILRSVPMLAAMIVRQDAESVDLNNGITIEITTASYRTIRGYTVVAALCDEIAYWRSEDSANPAEEILAALRPAMATIPGALLIMLSSPYKRSGPLYENYKRYFGQDGAPVLVIQADTRTMNPSVPQRVIDQAVERDPAAASAEYLAQFRSDVGTFLDTELVAKAVEPGRRERAPQHRFRYLAFTDTSGGSHDRMTLGIAHMEGHRLVLDLIRGVTPPFDPSVVVKEFAQVLRSYRCTSVTGDRYAGQWVVEAFARHGITYWHSDLSKSEVYLEALPLFTTQAVDLLDYQPLLIELQQLERRTAKSGRDSVDHPPHGHDDYANAACGALVLSAQQAKHALHMVRLTGL